MPPLPPKVFKVRSRLRSNPTLSRHVIENKQVTVALEMHRNPLSALVFIFGMSDMQFCAAPRKSQ